MVPLALKAVEPSHTGFHETTTARRESLIGNPKGTVDVKWYRFAYGFVVGAGKFLILTPPRRVREVTQSLTKRSPANNVFA